MNSIAVGSGRHPDDRNRRIGNGNGFKMGSSIGPNPNRHKFINNWSHDNIAQDFSINGGQGFLELSGNVCGETKAPCPNN